MANNTPNGAAAVAVPNSEPAANATDKTQEQYAWITNDGLLRDEGTLYGIANAPKENKLDAIEEYYKIRGALFAEQRNVLEKQAHELETKLNQVPGELKALLASYQEKKNEQKELHHLLPVSFQVTCYVAICSFNYFFFSYWLSPVIGSDLMCLGLYCFGLFSVYIGRSLLYNHTETLSGKDDGQGREKWKLYLEEFGVPLIAALFTCVLPFRAYPVEYSLSAFLFFFLLFLFGGKGLINSLFRWKAGFSSALKGWQVWFQMKKDKSALASEKKKLAERMESLGKELVVQSSELAKLEAEKNYKVYLFNSEYELASQGRGTFNKSQVFQFA
jgi:exonuclease VII large subunit